jgi:hypothetical protein
MTLAAKKSRSLKAGRMASQIAQIRPRSEIVIALIAIRAEICPINFPRPRVFTRPRSHSDLPCDGQFVDWTFSPTDAETK